MNTTRRPRILVVAVVALAADLGSKAAAVRWLDAPVSLGILDLRVTRNPGVAFSLGADQPAAVVLAVTGAVMVLLAVMAWREQLGGALPSGLIVGGGAANLADRIVGGSVVDLFDLGWWPVFNLADVFLTVGIALVFLSTLRDSQSEPDPVEPARG